MEHYEYAGGRYSLYCDDIRVLETDAIAVLLDLRRARILTHGDPGSVRRELDRLRALAGEGESPAWVLLEGQPCIATLNRALAAATAQVLLLHRAFLADSHAQARRIARECIERAGRASSA